MRRRTLLRLVLALAVLLALSAGVRATLQQLRPATREIPTARVRRGTLEIKVYSTGELRASKSMNLIAPPVSGALQIIRMAKTGARVKEGEIVLEFDPSEQEFKLEQSRSEVEEAEQQITKAKADTEVTAAQDKVALLKARFDVRRAELDVSRNELLSAIDAQKNRLALDEAKRRLAQLEQDIRSREVSNRASLAVLEEKRNKARLMVEQAQKTIETMRLKAPLSGTVVVRDNADAVGGWVPPGIIAPEYREGDVVRAGRIVAQILQVEDMEVAAKVDEADRAVVQPGQPVQVQIDALPDVKLPGKVKTVAGLVSREWFPEGSHRFDATFQIDKPDPRLRAGQSALVTIAGEQLRDALFLPRQALFDKDGKPVLYMKTGDHFQAREVKVTHRTESQVTVDGLNEGDEVALVNPDKAGSPAGKPTTAGPSVGGGR
jgi:HlyD family secretion protein